MEAARRVWSILYNGLLLLVRGAYPFYAVLARGRGVEAGELRQRLGFVESPLRDVIWIQAASVGEVGVGLLRTQPARDAHERDAQLGGEGGGPAARGRARLGRGGGFHDA